MLDDLQHSSQQIPVNSSSILVFVCACIFVCMFVLARAADSRRLVSITHDHATENQLQNKTEFDGALFCMVVMSLVTSRSRDNYTHAHARTHSRTRALL